MREERGTIAGPLVVHEPFTLWGSVGGDVIVVEGGKFYMRGSIYGSLNVEYGGRVHIYGNIAGNLKVARGSKVIHSGVVAGDAVNEGGRLYIDATAKVQGKIKTLKGETKVEPVPTVPGRVVGMSNRNNFRRPGRGVGYKYSPGIFLLEKNCMTRVAAITPPYTRA